MKIFVTYLISLVGLMIGALVIFRVLVRRDYLTTGHITFFPLLSELLICGLYYNFPYIYLPFNWPELPILPQNPYLLIPGLILVIAGSAFGLTGVVTLGFRRFLGLGPQKLQQGGIYSLNRNPQIVGFFPCMVGFAVLWPSWYALGWVIIYFPVFHMMVLTEEEYLLHLHGDSFRHYCQRVPRYIGISRAVAISLFVSFIGVFYACSPVSPTVLDSEGEGSTYAVQSEITSSGSQSTPVPLFEDTPLPEITSSLCPDAKKTNYITDFDVHRTPQLTEPAPRLPFRDPIFNTCLVRVTDRNSDLSPGDRSAGLKNEYSRVQSFNADGSLMMVRGTEATWYVYNTYTLQPLAQLPVDNEPRWDSNDPYLLYYSEETHLMSYDLHNGEHTLIHDFSADFLDQSLAAVWMRYEGSPSLDGRYWGLLAQDLDWQAVALLVYDQAEDRIVARRELRGVPDLDSVTISPLGNYFLAYFDYCESGLGDESHPCGLMVYDRNLQQARGLLRIIGHSDLVLDSDGRQVLVYQDIDSDHISMLDLESGTITPLWSIDFSHTPIGFHFSGRAFQQPGWVLVSTYDGDPRAYTWMDDQVFAIELKPGGRVIRLAHTHSVVDDSQEHDYWAEPHASVNQDFTRVLFTSNWGRSGTGEVEMYMIELPPEWLEELP